ncbi:MAG: hypothetical protein IPK72_21400 [Candidatus Eisenbacteria bacterium]|nr:hypothetical protein [Candidatus Eisenbacteria bacterium]
MAGRPPSEARAAEMRRVLADLDRTDLSTKAFCERRGISRSLLSYWRKRLTATDEAMRLSHGSLSSLRPGAHRESAPERELDRRALRWDPHPCAARIRPR